VKKAIPIILILISVGISKTSAQQISGTWVGNDERTLFIIHPTKIVVELDIKNDTIVTGVTHYYYSDGLYEHFAIRGRYFPNDSLIIFSEDSTISFNKKKDLEMFQSVYRMKINSIGGKLKMKGKLKEKGKGILRTTLETWFEKEEPQSANPNKDGPESAQRTADPGAISSSALSRVIDVQKVIELSYRERDSIKIELFDNGIIDDDTVSIYLNGVEILKHQRVSETPITFYTSLDRDVKFQKITMVADNMGLIPPNTALLVITTKEKKYDVYLSSDLNKNAVVEFFFKE
jgi:hypothetical protein